MSAQVDSALTALRLALEAGAERAVQVAIQRATLAPALRAEFDQRSAEIAAQAPPCAP